MAQPLDQSKAQAYADRLILANSHDLIDAICDEIEEVEGRNRYTGKSWEGRVSSIKKIIESSTVELKEGQNAYIQTRKNGDKWIRHYFIKAIGIADMDWAAINQASADKKIEALTDKKEISVQEYLDSAVGLLQSDNPHELAVGLIAVSGRRPIEILSLGEFAIKKSFDDMPAGVLDKAKNLNLEYYVNFSGQAKRGDNSLDPGEKLKYPIGLLVPADTFIMAFNKLRSMPECLEISKLVYTELDKGTSREAINAKIEDKRGNSLRRVTKRCFEFVQGKEGEITTKSLRACYVKLITERDCPKNIDDLLWASRSVGHFIDVESVDKNRLSDLITTLNYRYYYVNEPVPFVKPDVAIVPEKTKNVAGFVSDVDKLSELVKNYGFNSQKQALRYVLSHFEKSKNKDLEVIEIIKEVPVETVVEVVKEVVKEVPVETVVEVVKEVVKEVPVETVVEVVKEVVKEVPVETVVEVVKEVVKEVPVETVVEVEVIKEVPMPINTDLIDIIKSEIALQIKEALALNAVAKKDTEYHATTEHTTEITNMPKNKVVNKVDSELETVSSSELWKSKKHGSANEKIRRCFMAVGYYNGEVANGDNLPVIAVTNQVLRDLSRCNGQLVAIWMRDHADEIISHNENFDVFTTTGQLESYANRKLGINKVRVALEEINAKFLDGQGLRK